MTQNQCGSHNPGELCRGDRGCKNFLKNVRSETQLSESEHYISHRRRSLEEGGAMARRPVRGSPEAKMMPKFHRHINVDLCASGFGGIKYLFTYDVKAVTGSQ